MVDWKPLDVDSQRGISGLKPDHPATEQKYSAQIHFSVSL